MKMKVKGNMKKIDRTKLRNNILYFAKIKGLKIGDIERHIGRRVGIVARWDDKDTRNIPIDDIYNIAILLDMTIDDLIHIDVEELERQQKLDDLKLKRAVIDKQIQELESEGKK